MIAVPIFLVDFQCAADTAGKRETLQGWTVEALQETLNRNRVEVMKEPDSRRCRQILSGSILIRCELTRRRTGAMVVEQHRRAEPDAIRYG